MLPWGPVTLTRMLPDGSEIAGLPYHEADPDVRHRDASTYHVPVQSTTRTDWPERAVGVAGVRVNRLGRPHETRPATVRWLERRPGSIPVTARLAGPAEVPEPWPIARRGLRAPLPAARARGHRGRGRGPRLIRSTEAEPRSIARLAGLEPCRPPSGLVPGGAANAAEVRTGAFRLEDIAELHRFHPHPPVGNRHDIE